MTEAWQSARQIRAGNRAVLHRQVEGERSPNKHQESIRKVLIGKGIEDTALNHSCGIPLEASFDQIISCRSCQGEH